MVFSYGYLLLKIPIDLNLKETEYNPSPYFYFNT